MHPFAPARWASAPCSARDVAGASTARAARPSSARVASGRIRVVDRAVVFMVAILLRSDRTQARVVLIARYLAGGGRYRVSVRGQVVISTGGGPDRLVHQGRLI